MKEPNIPFHRELEQILKDPQNPDYFSKDIELAKKFDISRHSVYKVRDILKVPTRKQRIVDELKKLGDTSRLSIKQLAETLSIKYQNLYKLVDEFNIPHSSRKLTRKSKSESIEYPEPMVNSSAD